jgi:hypothetical protein
MKTFVSTVMTVACLCLAACTQNGTEVLSPTNPSESQKIVTPFYTIQFTTPEGWSYKVYGPGVDASETVFHDADPATITALEFLKGPNAFTMFYNPSDGGDLEAFMRQRHPVGDIQVDYNAEEGGYEGVFSSPDGGPNGGEEFAIYLEESGSVFWLIGEIIGTESEKQQTLLEFANLLNSAELVPVDTE